MGNGDEVYVAFLRGINVGGHHKVPMSDLKSNLEEIGLENVITVLNTGNVIFKSSGTASAMLEEKIEKHLSNKFGFPIPAMVRKLEDLRGLVSRDPFKGVAIDENIRLYITFTKKECHPEIEFPFSTEDGTFHILGYSERVIESYLDLGKTRTIKGMELLDKLFKTDITTRNYNTIINILKNAPPRS